MSIETWMLVMFAGGPGAAALVLQALRWWSDRPLRDANAAQVLTTTATGLLDHMEKKVEGLERDLRAAQGEISELRGRLAEATKHSEEVGRLQERLHVAEKENERLKALTSHREEVEIREPVHREPNP